MPMEVKIAHRKPNELISKQEYEDKGGPKPVPLTPGQGGNLISFAEGFTHA
jgi:hypothetical protein